MPKKKSKKKEDDLLKNIPEELLNDIEKLFQKYEINFDDEVISFLDLHKKIYQLISRCESNVEEYNLLIEFFWYISKTKVFILEFLEDYEEEYDEYIEFIEEILKINESLTKETIISFFNAIEDKIAIEEVMFSLLLMQDFYKRYKSAYTEIDFEKRTEKDFESYENALNSLDRCTFRIFMFDLAIKFGYIIETYVREVCLFLLKGYYIKDKDIRKYHWISEENNLKTLSIGRIIHLLREYDDDSEKSISKLRNAIFHSDFVINYDKSVQDRKIIILERNREKEENYMDFIGNFFGTIFLDKTFYHAILTFLDINEFKKIFKKEVEKIELVIKMFQK